jgi:hypothetical protein
VVAPATTPDGPVTPTAIVAGCTGSENVPTTVAPCGAVVDPAGGDWPPSVGAVVSACPWKTTSTQ